MQHQLLQHVAAIAIRYRFTRFGDQAVKVMDGAFQAQSLGRTGPCIQDILPCRFAQTGHIAQNISNVIGHLIGLAQVRAKRRPRLIGLTTGNGASTRCRDEQGACFGALILAQICRGFTFPSLARHNAIWQTYASGQVVHQFNQTVWIRPASLQQRLVGHHNEAIACQQGQGLGESLVDRGLSPAEIGVVKGGHVIVHQRGAVHEFQGHSGRVG